MKIIVGLGNPGKKYEATRHNAGFLVIDQVASRLGVTIDTKKFKSLISETFVSGEKIVLVKPQTFMNLSGEALREVINYYRVDVSDILIISDDKDLEVGKLRIRTKGSSGGQNGIKNIIHHLGTDEFLRCKVGIGSNPLIPTVDYVMGKIDDSTAIKLTADSVIDFINGMSPIELMNKYNYSGK